MQKLFERQNQPIFRRELFQELQRPLSLPVVQVFQHHLLGQLQDIDQLLLVAEMGPVDQDLYQEVKQDEDHIDQRHCGPEEVVVVAGDELAQLVNESPESKATQHRHYVVGGLVYVGQRYDQGDHHQHTAQKDMGYVQAARAEGGIAGQGQKEADAQDGEDGCYQEQLQKAGCFMVAHKMAVEELHGFMCPWELLD